jgi:hypothetical protein
MRQIALIVFFFSFYNVKAQSDLEKVKMISRAKDTVICFKCGLEKSKVVEEVTKLIQGKKYLEIKRLMLSNNAAEKFIAAATCKKLLFMKKLSLSFSEEKVIYKIFNSEDKLYTYSNDTYVEIKPIKYFVYDKKDRLIWSQTERWLEKVLK